MEKQYNNKIILLHELVQKDGFIYALCHHISLELNVSVDKVAEHDSRKRTSISEFQFLLGLWVKYGFSLSYPENIHELGLLTLEIPKLLAEIHDSMLDSMVNEDFFSDMASMKEEEVFMKKSVLKEMLFYAGDGAFEHQYIEHARKRYVFDQEWLSENKGLDMNVCCDIVNSCLKKRNYDNQQLCIGGFDELCAAFSIESEDEIKSIELSFIRYYPLFKDTQYGCSNELPINQLCDKILDFFCLKINDEIPPREIAYWDNFSCDIAKEHNLNLTDFTDFNEFTAKPIANLGNGKYFIPVIYLMCKALYETPYYWFVADKDYYNHHFQNNSGLSTEIIIEDILKEAFGKDKVLRSVGIKQSGEDETDIDVFAYEGSKALCVQIKSKKLAFKAYTGDVEKVKKDYEGAVQKAYSQALRCVNAIDNKSQFQFYHEGREIKLPSNVDEIYILCITSENFKGINFLNKILLQKGESEKIPHVMTAFDLELVVKYLCKPYLLIDYIRKRIKYNEIYNAEEEINYLGYHMKSRLWADDNNSIIHLNNDLSNDIIAHYYKSKQLGDDEELAIEWLNADYKFFLDTILELNSPYKLDVILGLLDYSRESQVAFLKGVNRICDKSLREQTMYSFSSAIFPDKLNKQVGITAVAGINLDRVVNSVNELSENHHYKTQNDWAGLGFLNGRLVYVVYQNSPFLYNKVIEERISNTRAMSVVKSNQSKIGRNEPCPCGSGKKYKKCCMKLVH